MAKATLNSVLDHLSGTLSRWTFRRTRDGTIISPKAASPKRWSVKQTANRERLKEAASFYRGEMADAVKAEHYRRRAKDLGLPVSSFVMGGYQKYGRHFAEMDQPAASAELEGRDGAATE